MPEPARADARVVARWETSGGVDTGIAAMILSDSGAYMGHVLTNADAAAKARMLLALVGHFVPEVFEEVARRRLARVGQMGEVSNLSALAEMVKAAGGERKTQAERELASVAESAAAARAALREGALFRAISLAEEAEAGAMRAYALIQPSRKYELRGAWIHTAYGVADWGWEQSIRLLAENGFNAIFPNMLWAGLAHYPSEVLPVAPEVEERGDQIAQALEACRRHGVELHIWKVNHYLLHAPAEFVERLRAEGRLQRSAEGEEVLWLCPSDERNFALERDSMLEVVRKYPVDGIHFDYIRYPGSDSCYCEGCRERFERDTGLKVSEWPAEVRGGRLTREYQEWRREQITRLVRAVSEEARRIRPGVQISAAVFGDWQSARESVGQDWVQWVREGLVDFVCPMDYTNRNDALRSLVERQVGWVGGRTPVYVGIGDYVLRDAAQLIDQVGISRALGADGFVCFHLNDTEFTGVRLPTLRLGATAESATLPHRLPRVEWVLPPPALEEVVPVYVAGEPLVVQVILPEALKGRAAEVRLETLGGEAAGEAHSEREGDVVTAVVETGAGRYRLGLWEGERLAAQKGPVLRFAEAEEVERERRRLGPPEFTGAGIAVAVMQGTYGGASLLEALQGETGIQALPLYQMTRDNLARCRVLVLPQPKGEQITAVNNVAAMIREWVESGGGLLVTHDMAGFRACVALFPEVAVGVDREESFEWQVVAAHPVVEGLPVGEALRHTYWDHVLLKPGAVGNVAAANARGEALVVAGQVGQGRVVVTGLGLGIYRPGDADGPPSEAERALLVNAVRWLAGE